MIYTYFLHMVAILPQKSSIHETNTLASHQQITRCLEFKKLRHQLAGLKKPSGNQESEWWSEKQL